jgi:hypothetical protein
LFRFLSLSARIFAFGTVVARRYFMPQMFRIAAIALPLAASLLLALTNVPSVHAQTVETGKREILLQADSSWNGKLYTQYQAALY